MASPPVLDIEALLEPISDDSPSGENLREAGEGDVTKRSKKPPSMKCPFSVGFKANKPIQNQG